MNLNFNVTGKQRKELVNAIAEILGETAKYQGTPSYAYIIGKYTVDKNGTLEGRKNANLEAKLAEQGFTADELAEEESPAEIATETIPETEGENTPETAPEIEEGGDDGESPESEPQGEISGENGEDLLTISYPVEGFSLTNLNNLCQMIIAKKPLIQKALGIDSVEIDYDETEIRFPWFKADIPSEDIKAYSQFITALCKTALAKKRVTAQPKESYDSERFSMRCFMISLDMKGAEFDYARKLMMRNLEGSSASPNADGVSKPRGERVEKQVLSVRFTPEMLDKIAELAGQSGMSRNGFIESVVMEYVQSELPESEEESADETPDDESADEQAE